MLPRPLTPENLLEDLGPSRAATWRVLGALVRGLNASREGSGVGRSFQRWRELFCRSSDWAVWSRNLGATPQFADLCEAIGLLRFGLLS